MQTKVYSDHQVALWCFTGLWSTPGSSVFTQFCPVHFF